MDGCTIAVIYSCKNFVSFRHKFLPCWRCHPHCRGAKQNALGRIHRVRQVELMTALSEGTSLVQGVPVACCPRGRWSAVPPCTLLCGSADWSKEGSDTPKGCEMPTHIAVCGTYKLKWASYQGNEISSKKKPHLVGKLDEAASHISATVQTARSCLYFKQLRNGKLILKAYQRLHCLKIPRYLIDRCNDCCHMVFLFLFSAFFLF